MVSVSVDAGIRHDLILQTTDIVRQFLLLVCKAKIEIIWRREMAQFDKRFFGL